MSKGDSVCTWWVRLWEEVFCDWVVLKLTSFGVVKRFVDKEKEDITVSVNIRDCVPSLAT